MLIDPHIHMVSRSTDDYQSLALHGIRLVTEPAFWPGYDRSAAGFRDYFEQLTVAEPARAARFGIRHYSWICINPKEAADVAAGTGGAGLHARVPGSSGCARHR